MTRIVTTHYRYKRPPRKQQAAPLPGPAVVTKRARKPKVAPAAVTAPPAANDDGKPAPKKSAIVTVRRPGKRDVPDLTPEEHLRRGDAATTLFREIQRRIAKEPP